MKDLEILENKLNNYGYTTYRTIIDNVEYLKGGYVGDDIEKTLSIEIWLYVKENKYVFMDIIKQTAEDKLFDSEEDVFNYIVKKFPL